MVLVISQLSFYYHMLKTLERYQKCNYGAPDHTSISAEEAMEISSQQEYLKLKARYEALQRTQRNLLGEDLGPLNSKDLDALEKQLDMSLKRIRSIRTQNMLDTLNDLQQKEHVLNETNRSLKQRLMEAHQATTLQWHSNGLHEVNFGRQLQQAPQQTEFFHPLECEPTLQIGYHQADPATVAAAAAVAATGSNVNNFMTTWLPAYVGNNE